MNRYNILFCEIYHDGTVGGSHSILFNIVKSLNKDLFNITVMFYGDNLYVKKMRDIGITVDIIESSKSSQNRNIFLRKCLNWYSLIYKNEKKFADYFSSRKFDLIIINNTLYTSSPYIRAAKKLKIPIIIYERGINNYSIKEISLSKYVAASIPMSDAIYDSVKKQRVKASKIVRVYDGIDMENSKPSRSKNEILADLGIPDSSKLVGIVGNIKPWKGQRYFVEAAINICQKYENAFALLIGGCSERDQEYLNELKQTVKKSGFEGRILFLGYRQDIPDILNALDVLVHASTRPEPFGMVVPEAMAAKVPAIATNFGGPVESLDNGKCGILVPPEDSRSIFDGIVRYLEDDVFREKTIDLAYERCCNYFSLPTNIELTEKIYLDVLKGK